MNPPEAVSGFAHHPAEGNRMDRREFQEKHGIIGRTLEMQKLVDTVIQVAPTDITVLITGESGTGKEVIAKAIYSSGARAGKRFVAVNCGAIPEGILESELFGHEKGAFTGAIETRKGYFELANGGTVFLDEIGETPLMTQVKLLRVLETGEFMRVGSSEQRHTDVRIIAATNKDLEREVEQRRFRQDLYYRLRSVNIRIPPLRERRADIPLFIDRFLEEALERDPTHRFQLTEHARKALQDYPWPGNVRELRHLIDSLFVLERDKTVDYEILAEHLPGSEPPVNNPFLPVPAGKSPDQAERELIFRALWELRGSVEEIKHTLNMLAAQAMQELAALPRNSESSSIEKEREDLTTLREMERAFIERVLERCGGNRRRAARILDISERTLYRKIRDFGLI